MTFFGIVVHLTFSLVVGLVVSIWYRKGGRELVRYLMLAIKELPGVEELVSMVLQNEVTKFVRQAALTQEEKATPRKERMTIPAKGTSTRV